MPKIIWLTSERSTRSREEKRVDEAGLEEERGSYCAERATCAD